MQNVLVTGGAGFIGSNFVRLLLAEREDVHVFNVDALTYAGHLESLEALPDPDRHTFIEGDIRDADVVVEWMSSHNIDTVVHFAAESHVDRSIDGPRAFFETNLAGTFNLLEAARAVWSDEDIASGRVRFHHVSTDEVFGELEPDDPAFSEETPYQPRSPYSASKAGSDHLVRAYWHTYGLPVTISNCTNNYGPYQYPEKLIPLFILNGMSGGAMPLYGDGLQIRDWLYVGDHCEAILRILEDGETGETYAIGGNNQPTNRKIAERICAELDAALPHSEHTPHAQLLTYVTDRPGHDRRYAMNISKIQEELGWSPSRSLESGIEETVAWYLSHGDWIRRVTEGSQFGEWIARNYGEARV